MDLSHAKETAAMNLLKVSQIAAELQVTPPCVYGWVKQGKLQAIRLGKLVRVEREELNRFLGRQAQGETRAKAESR